MFGGMDFLSTFAKSLVLNHSKLKQSEQYLKQLKGKSYGKEIQMSGMRLYP